MPSAKWRRVSIGLMALAIVAMCTLVVLGLSDIVMPTQLGPLRIRATDLLRPLATGTLIDLVLIGWCWRTRAVRWFGLSLLPILGVLALMVVARRAVPTWAVADGAILELYTIHATYGLQFLGPYSQYGWNHPGPALFYLFVPFYLIAGPGSVPLSATAVVINIVSLLTILFVLWRHARTTASLSVAASALTLVYTARIAPLLASPWNPHILVLPLMAALLLSADAASGNVTAFPVLLLFISFVCQSHMGVIPVAVALVVFAIVSAARVQARAGGDGARMLARSVNIAAWLTIAVWLLPIAEELTSTPGNMTIVWEFLRHEGQAGQPLILAMRVWADMLVGVVRPGFSLAQGWPIEPSNGPWSVLLAITELAALGAIAPWAFRSGRRFHGMLAVACIITSCIALWSTTRVYRNIVDHAVFWISTIGVINLAAIVSALAAPLERRWARHGASPAPVFAALTLLAFGVVGLSARQFVAVERHSHFVDDDGARVQGFTEQLKVILGQLHIRKPRINMDNEAWGAAVGVVLQLRRAGRPFAVDEHLLSLLGRPLGPAGDEDAEVTICGAAVHQRLATRPGNMLISQQEPFFMDVIKLRR